MRYHFLDNLRGLTFISMAAFHTMWDLTNLFDISAPWFYGAIGHVWQQSILWAFILISGFCWGLSRHHLKRGAIVFGAGALVTLATVLAMPSAAVYFGVLTFMGAAMMALAPFKAAIQRIPAIPALVVCALLFVVLRDVPMGYLGFESWHIVKLPEELYANWITTAFGFQMESFASSDYVPFLPWILLYLCGVFAHNALPRDEEGNLRLPKQAPWPVVSFLGRHSLGFYLIHQIAIYAALSAVFLLLK